MGYFPSLIKSSDAGQIKSTVSALFGVSVTTLSASKNGIFKIIQ